MNKRRLDRLFELVRNESAPAPPPDFPADVLRAIRREPQSRAAEIFSIFDQLSLLFPRVALTAAAVIVLCVALDFGLTAAGVPELGDAASQVSAQWLLPPDGF